MVVRGYSASIMQPPVYHKHSTWRTRDSQPCTPVVYKTSAHLPSLSVTSSGRSPQQNSKVPLSCCPNLPPPSPSLPWRPRSRLPQSKATMTGTLQASTLSPELQVPQQPAATVCSPLLQAQEVDLDMLIICHRRPIGSGEFMSRIMSCLSREGAPSML